MKRSSTPTILTQGGNNENKRQKVDAAAGPSGGGFGGNGKYEVPVGRQLLVGLNKEKVSKDWVKDMQAQADKLIKNGYVSFPVFPVVQAKRIRPEVYLYTKEIYMLFETRGYLGHGEKQVPVKMTLYQFEVFQKKMHIIQEYIEKVQGGEKLILDGGKRQNGGWKRADLPLVQGLTIGLKWQEEKRFSVVIISDEEGNEFALSAGGYEYLFKTLNPKLTNVIRMWKTMMSCGEVLIDSLMSDYTPRGQKINPNVEMLDPVEFEELAEELKADIDKFSLNSPDRGYHGDLEISEDEE